MNDEIKSKSYQIVVGLILALFVFGTLSFFVDPKFRDGATKIIEAVIVSLSMVLSFIFGVHVATPPSGTTSLVKTETPPEPPPQPAVS